MVDEVKTFFAKKGTEWYTQRQHAQA